MKIKYFQDTDTLSIELRNIAVAETKNYDEDTFIDVDSNGNVCGIILEYAKERTDIPAIS